MKYLLFIPLVLFALLAVNSAIFGADKETQIMNTQDTTTTTQQKALFAGGCFWCMEKPFEQMEGVLSVTSGYAGGTTTNPNYENYASGGHIEVVQIAYDPHKVSFRELLDV